jgi:hypothetical protein
MNNELIAAHRGHLAFIFNLKREREYAVRLLQLKHLLKCKFATH